MDVTPPVPIADMTDGMLGFRALALMAIVIDKSSADDPEVNRALEEAVREIERRGDPKDATMLFAGLVKPDAPQV